MSNNDPWEGASQELICWYLSVRRQLPWRTDPTPYKVWLSEVMLQQTRVETVIPYFERFVSRFPTIRVLAQAKEEEVMALWSGLGYYRRASSLLSGARAIMARHDGLFPKDRAEALELPGVGPYTAAAVLSIAYGIALPVVDGNVERVVARLLRLEGNVRRAAIRNEIFTFLTRWISRQHPGDFNQALMELGATVCKPQAPECGRCPLQARCAACAHGDPQSFPRLPPKRALEDVELETALLTSNGNFLLERREDLPFLRGVWVFPLCERGEGSIEERLANALGQRFEVTEELRPLRHAITYRRIRLFPKRLAPTSRLGKLAAGFRWVRNQEIGTTVPVSSLCLKILRRYETAQNAARDEAQDTSSS